MIINLTEYLLNNYYENNINIIFSNFIQIIKKILISKKIKFNKNFVDFVINFFEEYFNNNDNLNNQNDLIENKLLINYLKENSY